MMRLGFSVYWCSMTALMDSSSDCSRAWFVSLASRKLGEDMEVKSCNSLELVVVERC